MVAYMGRLGCSIAGQRLRPSHRLATHSLARKDRHLGDELTALFHANKRAFSSRKASWQRTEQKKRRRCSSATSASSLATR